MCLGKIDIRLLIDGVKLINKKYETEASGNVTIETVGEISRSGVDFISTGALTQYRISFMRCIFKKIPSQRTLVAQTFAD